MGFFQLRGMCSHLVHLFYPKLTNTVAKRYKNFKYKFMHVVFYVNYAYKNRTMPFNHITAVNYFADLKV